MHSSPFPIRGVAEGFYGVFYSYPERLHLIRWMSRAGFNAYLYAPKNDRQHRAHWREAYPAYVMQQFQRTIAAAQAAGIDFIYSLSPGVHITYSDPADWAALQAKLLAFYRMGVRTFALLLDDIAPQLRSPVDRTVYPSYAAAHADLANRLLSWLESLDGATHLYLCPTLYHGRPPFDPYLFELGRRLHPAIDLFFTGPSVCSAQITKADVDAFAQAVGRPPVLWDNYPVNDLEARSELHLGPLQGRAANLAESTRGMFFNPMQECEASRIPLATCADYLADPVGYDPQRSWEQALRTVRGKDTQQALLRLAENSLASCLEVANGRRLAALTSAALTALDCGEPAVSSPAVQALEDYLLELDDAMYRLKFRLTNLPLRNNLLPWVELLDHWQWVGRRAILVLRALEQGEPYADTYHMLLEFLRMVHAHPKRSAGAWLQPLADLALARVQTAQTLTTQPALSLLI